MGRAAFRIAFMMFVVSGIMVFALDPGTAEHIISVVTLILGIVFMAIIFVLVRFFDG
jgi:hypothetical protein